MEKKNESLRNDTLNLRSRKYALRLIAVEFFVPICDSFMLTNLSITKRIYLRIIPKSFRKDTENAEESRC